MHFSSLCRETGRDSLKLGALQQCKFLLFSNCLHLSWHLVCVSVIQLYLTLRIHGLQPTRLLCPWNSPGKNTGVGCHFLLPGIFPTQGLNPGLPHCRQILYCLSHQKSPWYSPSNSWSLLPLAPSCPLVQAIDSPDIELLLVHQIFRITSHCPPSLSAMLFSVKQKINSRFHSYLVSY